MTRDLGLGAQKREVQSAAVLVALEAVDQPVVVHDGECVVWANGAAQHLKGKPAGKPWAGGLVELASSVIELEGRERYLCVLAAPLLESGVDLESLSRTEAMALAAGGLAHDLGSPLSAMTAHLAALARGLLDIDHGGNRTAELDAVIERCRAAVLSLDEVSEYMSRLVRDFGRHTFGGVAGAMGTARVRRVVNMALRIMRGVLANRATVELVGQSDPCAAISEESLSRVLVNLIANAAEAFAPGRPHLHRIGISIVEAPSGIAIDVSDNAGGIPAEVVPRLFQPFVTSRPGRPGLGIGLAVARALARRSGGDLALVETGNEGSTFRVRLRYSTRS